MSSINLQGLIDKVLSMAQASVYGRKEDPNYWKDDNDKRAEERRRDTALALGQQAIDAKKYDDWKERMDLSRYGADDPIVASRLGTARKSLSDSFSSGGSSSSGGQTGKSFDEFIKAKLTANPMETAANMRAEWSALTSPAPTPADVASLSYKGMSNPDFRNAVLNEKSTVPKGGFGFVEGVDGKGFTRVLNGDVSSGPTVTPIATKTNQPGTPGAPPAAPKMTPEIEQAQRGFREKIPWYETLLEGFNRGMVGAETGIYKPATLPQSPAAINMQNYTSDTRKKEEEIKQKRIAFYEDWNKKYGGR